MKSFKSIIALAMCAVAIVGCKSKNEPSVPTQQEIETKIIGKWKQLQENGKEILTNDRKVNTYLSDKTGYRSASLRVDGVYIWDNHDPITFSIEENKILIHPTKKSAPNDLPNEKPNDALDGFSEGGQGGIETYTILEISESSLHYKEIRPAVIGESQSSIEVERIFQRVLVNYSNDIIGMWEGIEMTGYETYGNAEARIEYRADGTYTYYVKDGDNWVASKNVDNEYNVDGDWLATRWRPEAGKDFNYEWWDIDEIKDDTMKWSALREKEDSTRFTTTFTWKKVK